ncbi:2Fe-2S iron-sulfur cluster binding domain-containing protein, partial [Micrococcus luteus]|nr:2Fe-2S iron-sulfur cluster binding domain-containing protein [Micrococcus luteus]
LNTLEKLAEQYNFELKFELFGSGSSLLNPELENTFDVELIDTGKVYHVPKHKTLLEVLLDNEIDLPHDCLEGLCGSCEVIVIEGEIDHRDKSL